MSPGPGGAGGPGPPGRVGRAAGGAGTPGLIIAAPASGSGKTTVTLGLLRALRRRGVAVGSLKVGPDYIDPAFHAAAGGRPCRNVDAWAMRPATLARVLADAGDGAAIVVAEGVMGLFDGSPDGTGSTADVAALTGWPVVLVLDVSGQAASAAAVALGFARYRADVGVAGVLLNRVGGPGHRRTLDQALAGVGLPVLGALPRRPDLAVPSRHLGLVPAEEHAALEPFLERAAAAVEAHADLDRLIALARPARPVAGDGGAGLAPLGQRIAVARDAAFAFAYPHVLEGWHRAGAELAPFSPLADEAPDPAADAVYLAGGYPELHAGRLAAAGRLLGGLRAAAGRGAAVLGECGGYMVLGAGLIDGDGRRHAMAGLLPLESSMAAPRLHLGYRRARLAAAGPLGPAGAAFAGHEFHYAEILDEGPGAPLFRVADALGADLGGTGRRARTVMGSFVHLIDRWDAPG